VNVVDHAFGLDIPDPYRWMETEDAERNAWMQAQGSAATAVFASEAGRAELYYRIATLSASSSAVSGVVRHHGRMVYSTRSGDSQLFELATREHNDERILIDPAQRGSADTHVSVDNYSLSPNGKLVAYNISNGGSEVGDIHVMDVATGKDLPDVEPRIWGEFHAHWTADSAGFFYTQMAAAPGADPMLNMSAHFHSVGQPIAADVAVMSPSDGLAWTPEEFPDVSPAVTTPYSIASFSGAHDETRYAIAKTVDAMKGTAHWTVIAELANGVSDVWIHGDRIYLETIKSTPNHAIVSVPIAHPDLATARVEIAEAPDAVIDSVTSARDAVYFTRGVNGRSQLFRWTWHGAPERIELPGEGWIYNLVATSDEDGALFQLQSWLAPATYYSVTRTVAPLGLASTSAATSAFAQIADDEVEVGGAKIPLTILHRKDTALDGSHPTIVDGYGAYGISFTPYFDATRLAWLERGGVLAIAHVRGGGEKGRRWQDAGSHAHKLQGSLDLIECVDYLVDHKWTTHGRIAIEGDSMGGILVGRALTERPDIVAVVRIGVGEVNPSRLAVEPNGANQFVEVGDPRTEQGFKDVVAMDTYLHVKSAAYPAVILNVGLHDNRVVPWGSAKLAARLLASTTSNKPILLRLDPDAGHGMGSTSDQYTSLLADVWSFMLARFH
jgi:prolyl oligopeptidase